MNKLTQVQCAHIIITANEMEKMATELREREIALTCQSIRLTAQRALNGKVSIIGIEHFHRRMLEIELELLKLSADYLPPNNDNAA